MADVMRYRHVTGEVMCLVDSAQVIEIGDLVWLNTDDVRPASQVSFAAGIAQAQEDLVDNFLGVAMGRSRSGDTAAIKVATEGVFEFVTASDTFQLGDLVGAADNTTELHDQQVVSLGDGHTDADAPRAIGRCAKQEATAVTTVLIEIKSTVMTGGYQLGIASV